MGLKHLHLTLENWLTPHGAESRFMSFAKQFIWFGYLQAISCVFPVLIFLSLALSSALHLGIPRYDLLLIVCILAQVIMYKTGLETRDEVLVITMFHLLGLIMELHKVYHGSWSYPDQAYTKVFGVPLYSGFMYASVGSYICQAWRNLRLDTVHWPKTIYAVAIGAAIYLNFFTNAFITDLRFYITVMLIIIFWRTKFSFRLHDKVYYISALLSFVIIGFFIWLAENIATFFGAWKYAYQHKGWQMVTWHKITSWSLLVIVSIIIVGQLKRLKESRGVKKH
ncbi:MAG TPA: DUF817 domain-containing protein [Ohtaekwangia sp.]|uniref:DUF817 domain-containing protein n=1 Tax=Ohtaekwangia sp. TaxID=2066019 RepID=UPI002F942CAB